MIAAIRAGIAGLSIGQRIAGAALTLALWLAPAGAVWLHMHGKLGAEHALGVAEATATFSTQQVDALTQAIERDRAERAKAQAALDEQAGRDRKAIAADLAAVARNSTRATKELQAYALAHPLPADCRADPDRVRLWNAARRGDAPEG